MNGRACAAAAAALLALTGCTSTTTVGTGPTAQVVSTPTRAQRLSEEDPAITRARVHTELAAGYFELRNMAVALEEVTQALKAEPNYAPAYNVAGLIHAELKNDQLAQEHFLRALRLNPVDPDSNNNYGRFLCDRQRESEAIKYFLAALRNPLYQNRERSYVNAGLCLRRQGDVAGAEGYFLSALKVAPNHAHALYHLADIHYARGDYVQAKKYLIRLEQVAPPVAETLWLALRIEHRLGDHNAAASYGQQLRRQFPDSKEARALLAGAVE